MSLQIAPSSRADMPVKSTLDTAHAEYGSHDTLRYGIRSIKSEVLPAHPLENRLAEWDETQWELKLALARRVYGLHAPLRLSMERDIVSKRQRPAVLPSSNLHADILLGRDDTIDIGDVFGQPSMSTEFVDMHSVMEHKLKL